VSHVKQQITIRDAVVGHCPSSALYREEGRITEDKENIVLLQVASLLSLYTVSTDLHGNSGL
jgi:hypothetical protein